jgi:hypothetical protein
MTSFQNDKLVFKVVYRDQAGLFHSVKYDTFAKAAGHASALNGISRCIDAEFRNETSSWSGSMYHIDRHNMRRVTNEYFLKSVIKFLAKQSDK